MPTNRDLTKAVAKEFKVSERKMRTIMGKINPDATAHPSSQVRPFTLKKVLKQLPKALREFKETSGLNIRGLNKRDDILRREIGRDVQNIDAKTAEAKADKPKPKQSAVDYLDKIRNPKTNSETTQNKALTSGSALARQAETKPQVEKGAGQQSIKPMHVDLAPGFEKIESTAQAQNEPVSPDIG